jgi:hypothetical protein
MRDYISLIHAALTNVHASFLNIFRVFPIDTRPYHRERHYMRGPGPKWHEKHGNGAVR